MRAGELVRGLRERHGLSQAGLAYRAGTTQQAISRIEQGKVSPTVDMLAHLASACGDELVLDARPACASRGPDSHEAAASRFRDRPERKGRQDLDDIAVLERLRAPGAGS
jgi:transcriptional regulator with XRE-family HTH domain